MPATQSVPDEHRQEAQLRDYVDAALAFRQEVGRWPTTIGALQEFALASGLVPEGSEIEWLESDNTRGSFFLFVRKRDGVGEGFGSYKGAGGTMTRR